MIKFRLKELMDEREVTIKEVHEATKISRTTLSNMYNGKTNGIQFDNLDKLIEALNCHVSELMHYTPKSIEFSFEYVNGIYYFKYNDGQINDQATLKFRIDYDDKPVDIWIDRLWGPVGNPFEKLALISKSLVDILFYEFVDFLLRENKIDSNLTMVFADHQVTEFIPTGKDTGRHTIVAIENGRVNTDMIERLAYAAQKENDRIWNVDFSEGVKITFR